jgi:membrane protease YdiL (CAAX protease family)
LWIVTAILLAVVIIMQRPPVADPKDALEDAAGLGTIEAPKSDIMILLGKLRLNVMSEAPRNTPVQPGPFGDPNALMQGYLDQMAGWSSDDFWGGPPSAKNLPRKHKDDHLSAADRLRATILAGESMPPEETEWRLKDVESDLDPKSPLRDDVRVIRTLAEDGNAASISEADKEGLTKRHGWFARIALTRGDSSAQIRQDAIHAGGIATVLLLGFAIVFSLAVIAGVALLITGGIMWILRGKAWWAMRRPDPATEWPADPSGEPETAWAGRTGRGLWLETVATFLLAFMVLGLTGRAIVSWTHHAPWTMWITLIGQWAIALVIFWPVVRGMPWSRWRADIGWNPGRGVFREILAGIAGYLAGLPLYLAWAFVCIRGFAAVGMFGHSHAPSPKDNKVFDIIEGGSPFALVMLYLLATVWAPIVEESIFRGALFRQLRRRWLVVPAAIVTGAVFAVAHPYPTFGLFIVGGLGFWFAIIRTWRGTLIASATAHALHNAVALGLIMSLLALASG